MKNGQSDLLGEREEAVTAYRAALNTAARADELFSGAGAIKALLDRAPESGPHDELLIGAVIVEAWRVLKLGGDPAQDSNLFHGVTPTMMPS